MANAKQNQEQRKHKVYAKQNMKSIQMFPLTKALQRGKVLPGDATQTNNPREHRDANLMRIGTLLCGTLRTRTLAVTSWGLRLLQTWLRTPEPCVGPKHFGFSWLLKHKLMGICSIQLRYWYVKCSTVTGTSVSKQQFLKCNAISTSMWLLLPHILNVSYKEFYTAV